MQCTSHKCCYKSIFSVVVVGVIAAVVYFGIIHPRHHHQKIIAAQEVKIDGLYLPSAKDINDFQLTDNHGNTFTKANLKGHWTMMFFGFTNCGYVCPTTLSALNIMYKDMQKQYASNEMPQVVMVSVDPDRDSVARMNDYVTAYNPNFIGARGDMMQTQDLEKQLHIVAVKMQADGMGSNHYMMNHSAEILVFNPNAELQAYLSFPHTAQQMMQDYQTILKQKS